MRVFIAKKKLKNSKKYLKPVFHCDIIVRQNARRQIAGAVRSVRYALRSPAKRRLRWLNKGGYTNVSSINETAA